MFDGHDGEAAACYVKEHLLPSILGDASFPTAVEEAVKNAYLDLDKRFSEACRLDDSLSSGTTVLTALIQGRLVNVDAFLFFDLLDAILARCYCVIYCSPSLKKDDLCV